MAGKLTGLTDKSNLLVHRPENMSSAKSMTKRSISSSRQLLPEDAATLATESASASFPDSFLSELRFPLSTIQPASCRSSSSPSDFRSDTQVATSTPSAQARQGPFIFADLIDANVPDILPSPTSPSIAPDDTLRTYDVPEFSGETNISQPVLLGPSRESHRPDSTVNMRKSLGTREVDFSATDNLAKLFDRRLKLSGIHPNPTLSQLRKRIIDNDDLTLREAKGARSYDKMEEHGFASDEASQKTGRWNSLGQDDGGRGKEDKFRHRSIAPVESESRLKQKKKRPTSGVCRNNKHTLEGRDVDFEMIDKGKASGRRRISSSLTGALPKQSLTMRASKGSLILDSPVKAGSSASEDEIGI